MNDRQTELKEHSAHIFEMGCMEQRVYLKNDADAVIEAKDAEIAEIKQRYNDMDIAHTVHIAKMNAKIEELESNERRLKRALWLARALRARDKAFEYHFKNNVEMCAKWDNVHLMLMAKAEGYK
jgi:HAMP domain-containing protein